MLFLMIGCVFLGSGAGRLDPADRSAWTPRIAAAAAARAVHRACLRPGRDRDLRCCSRPRLAGGRPCWPSLISAARPPISRWRFPQAALPIGFRADGVADRRRATWTARRARCRARITSGMTVPRKVVRLIADRNGGHVRLFRPAGDPDDSRLADLPRSHPDLDRRDRVCRRRAAQTIPTYMFGSLDNFPLLAVPFFVLAGEIMGQGGIARRVVAWVVSIIGGVRGSLAVTTVASSELFGAMAHTSVGTVVAVGRLLYPSLTQERLQRALLRRPDHLVRRGRRYHSAVDLR